MKRFNPEKELKKIQKGNRNKVIFGVILLLIIISIGSTYALYQVRYSKRIMYTKVADFSKDLNLAVYLDGEKQTEFPPKSNSTVYTNIDCNDSNVTASWNYEKWGLEIFSKLPNKCNVYFETRYKDKSGASYPELYKGLIPITIGSNGTLTVAKVTEEWYDYDNHNWANAVLIDDTKNHEKYYNEDGTYKGGTTIPIDDVLQMYVWIPRYRYKLFNAISGQSSNPQMIDIIFESNTTGRSMGTNNGQWYTHPAFLFGDTELNGFWVGKFEPSDPEDLNGRTNRNQISEITILPDKTSMIYRSVLTLYNAERDIEKQDNKYNLNPTEVDTRPMKNMEWGAVAYLTSSKYGIYSSNGQSCVIAGMTKENCEVWINNTAQGAGDVDTSATYKYGGTYTGCVGESVSAAAKWNADDNSPAKCDADKRWNTGGVKASTTGNMYGIYDMVGGTDEYMMGVIKNEAGTEPYYNTTYSGFDKSTMPEAKYYDLYEFSNSSITHGRGYLGDATREIVQTFGDKYGGWNGDITDFPFVMGTSPIVPWFMRGGSSTAKTLAGVFSFGRQTGSEHWSNSFRSVLSAA